MFEFMPLKIAHPDTEVGADMPLSTFFHDAAAHQKHWQYLSQAFSSTPRDSDSPFAKIQNLPRCRVASGWGRKGGRRGKRRCSLHVPQSQGPLVLDINNLSQSSLARVFPALRAFAMLASSLYVWQMLTCQVLYFVLQQGLPSCATIPISSVASFACCCVGRCAALPDDSLPRASSPHLSLTGARASCTSAA